MNPDAFPPMNIQVMSVKLDLAEDVIREEVIKVLTGYGKGSGHVFNLGHGILPDVNPERARALVQMVHEESRKFH